MKLYGFTLLRNGVKYDYPFRESLRSLAALCDEVYVALGKSDDGTEGQLAEFKNLRIIPTVWDENLRKSGLVLSQQTNIALDALRAEKKEGWGIYLQADEVLNEADFPRIRRDIEAAEVAGADALSFRYLHFWQTYDRLAFAKRWYPQEIRGVRLGGSARSYGDAQSFEGVNKRFETDAFVYHYGHVREPQAYAQKKADFNRWWHGDEEMKKVLAKGARRDKHEPTLPYYGPHPGFMRERIGQARAEKKKVLVYGEPGDISSELKSQIRAELEFTDSLAKVMQVGVENTVFLRPLPPWALPFRLAGYGSSVPSRMHSPQAREWSPDFQARLKFSEKGIYSV